MILNFSLVLSVFVEEQFINVLKAGAGAIQNTYYLFIPTLFPLRVREAYPTLKAFETHKFLREFCANSLSDWLIQLDL